MPRDGIMPSVLNGLDLGATEFLLVKFYFTNPAHIPDGIKRIVRKDEQELIRKRMDALKAATPADTRGTKIVDNALSTSAEYLFAGLHAAGLVLLDVQNWAQVKPGHKAKRRQLCLGSSPGRSRGNVRQYGRLHQGRSLVLPHPSEPDQDRRDRLRRSSARAEIQACGPRRGQPRGGLPGSDRLKYRIK